MKKYIAGISVIVLVVAAVFARELSVFSSPSVSAPSGEIRIPLSKLSEKAQWLTYEHGGTTVRFFVVRAGDSIKTAFDACDVCYWAQRGYSQEGDFMVCNNCGKRYPITSLGTENKEPGGCWPGYLPHFVEGEDLVIRKVDLEEGAWRFMTVQQ